MGCSQSKGHYARNKRGRGGRADREFDCQGGDPRLERDLRKMKFPIQEPIANRRDIPTRDLRKNDIGDGRVGFDARGMGNIPDWPRQLIHAPPLGGLSGLGRIGNGNTNPRNQPTVSRQEVLKWVLGKMR
jgi:hypothetical protein